MGSQMLSVVKHDTTGFGRYSSLSALAGCSAIPLNLLMFIRYGEMSTPAL
jgi:hypothetical protein